MRPHPMLGMARDEIRDYGDYGDYGITGLRDSGDRDYSLRHRDYGASALNSLSSFIEIVRCSVSDGRHRSGTRVGSAAAWQHAGDHSLRRAIATSRANATSFVGRDFPPKSHRTAGPRASNGLCDDEGVPLICPTCQVLAQSVLVGDRLLPCMGLFSIFLVGGHSDAAWL